MIKAIRAFFIDYHARHRNNMNRILHIIGVPLAFYGFFQILTLRWREGMANVFIGYLFQYIGHTFYDKNEVGEWILIKKIVSKLRAL